MKRSSGIHDPVPSFVWFPWVKPTLPVFTFHGVEPVWFESVLQFLVKNHYRSLNTKELEILFKKTPSERKDEKVVVLTFDDARFTEWLYGYPLLKKYGMKAINFVVPTQIETGTEMRMKLNDPQDLWNRKPNWEELRFAEAQGVFDVQSHSLNHDLVFSDKVILDFQRPTAEGAPLYPEFYDQGVTRWGEPIFERAWRPVVTRNWVPSKDVARRCSDWVAQNGGEQFFQRPGWKDQLLKLAKKENSMAGNWEELKDSPPYLQDELLKSKLIIEEKLQKKCEHFSPPVHSYHDGIIQAAAKCGYRFFYNGLSLKSHQEQYGVTMVKRVGGHWAFYLSAEGYLNYFKKLLNL